MFGWFKGKSKEKKEEPSQENQNDHHDPDSHEENPDIEKLFESEIENQDDIGNDHDITDDTDFYRGFLTCSNEEIQAFINSHKFLR